MNVSFVTLAARAVYTPIAFSLSNRLLLVSHALVGLKILKIRPMTSP